MMNKWRRLSYSLSIAVLLTALAGLFDPGIGEFLAVPGIIFEGWMNLLILMLSKEEYPFQFDNWIGFSLLFYTLSAYFILWLHSIIREANAKAELK